MVFLTEYIEEEKGRKIRENCIDLFKTSANRDRTPKEVLYFWIIKSGRSSGDGIRHCHLQLDQDENLSQLIEKKKKKRDHAICLSRVYSIISLWYLEKKEK